MGEIRVELRGGGAEGGGLDSTLNSSGIHLLDRLQKLKLIFCTSDTKILFGNAAL
jgi:hypothetical protein